MTTATWNPAQMPSGAIIAAGNTCKCNSNFDHEVTGVCGSKYEARLAAIAASTLSIEAQIELAAEAKAEFGA